MEIKSTLNLNEFLIQDKIGKGTFGAVYKVKEKKSGRIYAAKISFKPLEDESIETLLILSREVNILSKINHPSILKFIGFSPTNFKNDPNPVIITEYLPNGTLYDIIGLERKSISKEGWNDTLKLINIYGIASAMSYLHSHKIIHRDLKPSNILMDENLLPKIADFGLSKIQHTNSESMSIESINGLKGSPVYMSPEIMLRYEYSPACDVYAFGMIVYEIITTEELFKDCTLFVRK